MMFLSLVVEVTIFLRSDVIWDIVTQFRRLWTRFHHVLIMGTIFTCAQFGMAWNQTVSVLSVLHNNICKLILTTVSESWWFSYHTATSYSQNSPFSSALFSCWSARACICCFLVTSTKQLTSSARRHLFSQATWLMYSALLFLQIRNTLR